MTYISGHDRIMERFRISLPQASKDIGDYQKMAPRNLAYDHRAKVYLKTEKFKPVFKPDTGNSAVEGREEPFGDRR